MYKIKGSFSLKKALPLFLKWQVASTRWPSCRPASGARIGDLNEVCCLGAACFQQRFVFIRIEHTGPFHSRNGPRLFSCCFSRYAVLPRQLCVCLAGPGELGGRAPEFIERESR